MIDLKIVSNVGRRNDIQQLRQCIFIDIHNHHSGFGLQEDGLIVELGDLDTHWCEVLNPEETHNVRVYHHPWHCIHGLIGRLHQIVHQEDINPLAVLQHHKQLALGECNSSDHLRCDSSIILPPVESESLRPEVVKKHGVSCIAEHYGESSFVGVKHLRSSDDPTVVKSRGEDDAACEVVGLIAVHDVDLAIYVVFGVKGLGAGLETGLDQAVH